MLFLNGADDELTALKEVGLREHFM